MHTVLRIDLQAIGLVFVFDVFVNTSRAIASLGAGKLGQVDAHRYAGVLQGEVRRLVFFVVGIADEHAAQAVKGNFSVRFGVYDGLALRCG